MTEAPQQAPAESGATEAPETPEVPEGYVPQKTVNKVVGERAKEARQAAINDLLEKSGAESVDDMLSVYEAHKLTQAEMESAADKAEKARQKAEAKAQAAEERYTNTLREFALRDALRDSGINPERLKGAMRLADFSSLGVDAEGNVTGLYDVVTSVKEEAPEFFGDANARPRINAPQTTGTGVRRPGANEDPKTQMGGSLLGWLTEPVEEQSSWP